jgi:hypothetical protein
VPETSIHWVIMLRGRVVTALESSYEMGQTIMFWTRSGLEGRVYASR